MLKVKAIPGEPSRFRVEGNSFRCSECPARFLKRENSMMREGMACPKCHKGFIEERYHLVDIASYNTNGACSCEWFHYELAPKVKKMSKGQRLTNPLRCAHISIARSFCLDVLLELHNWEQRGSRPVEEEHEI
jgi:hypothetical protein